MKREDETKEWVSEPTKNSMCKNFVVGVFWNERSRIIFTKSYSSMSEVLIQGRSSLARTK